MEFNVDEINTLQQQFTNVLQGIDHVTQHIVDSLYINIKNMLINPARNTGIYRERKRKTKHINKKPRRHGKQVWYNEDCEVSRKECMLLKNSLMHDNTTHIQHQEFHKKVQSYKKLVIKTKQIYTKQFHREIRSLKSRNPKEFWKIIQTECKQNSSGISSLIFTGFIDHFRELNSDPRFSGYNPQSNTSLVPENDVINHPFTLLEIKATIKLLKNNKACGVDNVINEFFKYCHNDCLELIVAFFNIVLSTGYVPTDWCLGIICPIYKNKGSIDEPDNYRGTTLLSCTCKLFTACLNSRLSLYVNDDILGREQAGFREGYSTIDHAFVLHLVIELYQ